MALGVIIDFLRCYVDPKEFCFNPGCLLSLKDPLFFALYINGFLSFASHCLLDLSMMLNYIVVTQIFRWKRIT